MTVGVAGAREGVLRRVVAQTGLDTDTPKVELSETLGKIQPNLTDWRRCHLREAAARQRKTQQSRRQAPRRRLHRHPEGGCRARPRHGGGSGTAHPPIPERPRPDRPPARRHGHRPVSPDRDGGARPVSGGLSVDRGSRPSATRGATRQDQGRHRICRSMVAVRQASAGTRKALRGLSRYIATVETSKHRFFQFLDASIRPDNMLVNIGIGRCRILGFSRPASMSIGRSRREAVWVWETTPATTRRRCFDPFPFPAPDNALRARVRDLGERLDAHRKSVLDSHGHLTMTGLYNVLEKVRAGETLTDADTDVYDAGLVAVLAISTTTSTPPLPRLTAGRRICRTNRSSNGWWRSTASAPPRSGTARCGGCVPNSRRPGTSPPRSRPGQIEAELVVAGGAARKPRLPAALPDQVASVRAALARMDDIVTPLEVSRQFAQGKRVEKKVETYSAPSPCSARPNTWTAPTSWPSNPRQPPSPRRCERTLPQIRANPPSPVLASPPSPPSLREQDAAIQSHRLRPARHRTAASLRSSRRRRGAAGALRAVARRDARRPGCLPVF